MTGTAKLLLAALAARATPLTFADARLLFDCAEAIGEALFSRGVECEFVPSGVCKPSTWTDVQWTRQAMHCRSCPLFKKAAARRKG